MPLRGGAAGRRRRGSGAAPQARLFIMIIVKVINMSYYDCYYYYYYQHLYLLLSHDWIMNDCLLSNGWALCPAWFPKVSQAAQHVIYVAVRAPARPIIIMIMIIS